MLPPRSRARRSCGPAPAPARAPSVAALSRLSLLPAGEPLPSGLEQLIAPAVEERLRDRVLAADLPHRAVAAQPGQHDLELLLRRERPVLPLLAQPSSPFGRAAHAAPDAGQSLRRYELATQVTGLLRPSDSCSVSRAPIDSASRLERASRSASARTCGVAGFCASVARD